MKPITKAEVKHGYGRKLRTFEMLESAKEFLNRYSPIHSRPFWLMVGYEIARARAEKGEEL